MASRGLEDGGCRGACYVYIPVVDERTFVTTAIKQLPACVARDYGEVLSV